MIRRAALAVAVLLCATFSFVLREGGRTIGAGVVTRLE